MAVTLTYKSYILNNVFCPAGTLIPIDCSKFNTMGYGWFVTTSNIVPDGCGGYYEIGTPINENTSLAYPDDTIKLLHIQSPTTEYWISGTTTEEFKDACHCVNTCMCVLRFSSDADFPIEGNNTTVYISSTTNPGVYIWTGSGYTNIGGGGGGGSCQTASITTSAEPAIDTDSVDQFFITALDTNITSFTTNLTGTPTDCQKLIITITDDGTPRNIAWGSGFEDSTMILPIITVASTRMDIGFLWNSVTSKWRCVAVA